MTEEKNSWRYYLFPGAAWDAMYADCEKASESIFLEQYIVENDAMGQRFLELFTEKAAAGVKVTLICDMMGSLRLYFSPLVRRLKRAGGKCHFYHPLRFWHVMTPWRWFPRTHVKTLLVDGKIGFVGGVCIATYMGNWRDTHIRVTGEVTEEIAEAHEQISRRLKHKKERQDEAEQDYSDAFRYVQNRQRGARYHIYHLLLEKINAARNAVYLVSPFYVPNRKFHEALINAARRGVDVRLMVPRLSDVPVADWVRHTFERSLLAAGVRIFWYDPTVLHSKTAMIDGEWATVGSTNMDMMSFFYNREANLVIQEKEAVETLREHFHADMAHCTELTMAGWQEIAFRKIAVGYLGRALKLFF